MPARMYSGCSFTGGEIKRIKPIAINIIDGGVWKGASYIKNLGSRKTRSGTYDAEIENRRLIHFGKIKRL
ncbi:putative RNase toxin 21 of polymorphic toxin system [Cytobacillus horneckiae]